MFQIPYKAEGPRNPLAHLPAKLVADLGADRRDVDDWCRQIEAARDNAQASTGIRMFCTYQTELALRSLAAGKPAWVNAADYGNQYTGLAVMSAMLGADPDYDGEVDDGLTGYLTEYAKLHTDAPEKLRKYLRQLIPVNAAARAELKSIKALMKAGRL